MFDTRSETQPVFSEPHRPGYGPHNWGVWIPAEARDFSPLKNIQSGCGSHSLSYSMGTRGSFPSGKAART